MNDFHFFYARLYIVRDVHPNILVLVMHLCLQVEDPLTEATKYLKLLQSNSSDSLETHILSFELNMRKQKVLLAFQVCLILSTSLFWDVRVSCYFLLFYWNKFDTIKRLVCLIIREKYI